MHSMRKTYLSAAGKDWLLPFYDPFTKLLGVETVHRDLITQANAAPGQRFLEIGCGTGNLAIMAKTLTPGAEVVGIDPDPKALGRARRKAERRRVTVQFAPGFSEELPYPDSSFDRVFSAFMLHHVNPDAKHASLQQAYRVLKPGGSLHLADFEEGEQLPGGFHGVIARLMHSRHGSSSHHAVLDLMRHAGFADTQVVAQQTTVLGRVVFYKGVRVLLAVPPAA